MTYHVSSMHPHYLYRAPARKRLVLAAWSILSVLAMIFPALAMGENDFLTLGERSWLQEHNHTFVVNREAGWPPIMDLDKHGNPHGIAIDYCRVLEKKLGITFVFAEKATWTNILNNLREKRIDVVCDIQKSPERSKYALFTEPYITIPNVIIVPQGHKGPLTPEDLNGMRVAVVENSAIHEQVSSQYPEAIINAQKDDPNCLFAVSTKDTDAAIVSLAFASYFIDKTGISNLKIAGNFGSGYSLSFATRDDWPILRSILDKGIKEISKEEREDIFRKWIHLEYVPFYKTRNFWIVTSAVATVVFIVILSILTWNRSLNRLVKLRTKALQEKNLALKNEIVERKNAVAALRESESQFRSLYENSPYGMIIAQMMYNEHGIPIDAQYLDANAAVSVHSGLAPEEVIGKRATDIRPSESLSETLEIFNQVVSSGKPYSYVEYLDAMERTLTMTGSALVQDKFMILFHDVSNIVQKENELRSLRNELSDIINSMPSVLVGVDVEGKITHWNKTAERASGITAEEAKGMILSDLFPTLSPAMDKILESVKSKEIIHERMQRLNKDKSFIYEDITVYPLFTRGEEAAVIRMDNVTERVRMEETLIQSEKMLSMGGLAAGMAHEINNPLAGIMQTANVLANRLWENSNLPANLKASEAVGTSMEVISEFMKARGVPEMLNTIIDSGERVASIVDNMLSFARKEEGSSSTHSMHDLMDKTLDLASTDFDLKKHYDFKQIKIVKDYDPDIPLIPCQSGKIQQVLLNIIHNATYAMREAGTENPSIALRTYRDKEQNMVCMEIEDNGPGMEEETRKRIFEPFFTTKPEGVGTGLGLSVSYFIITKTHQGEMDVESQLGLGTKFVIRIPITS